MDSVAIFSPGSVANVCCGFDVLGFCLDPIGDRMIVRQSKTPGIRISDVKGFKVPLNPKKNVASVAAEALLKDYPSKFGYEIEIDKTIKPGSGLGSSASSASGAVFAINELMGRPLDRKQLIQYALAGERLASGAKHADNLAPVLLGGFTLVRCLESMDVLPLPTPNELVASIVHPKIELKTSYARAILKKEVFLQDAVHQWANVGAFVSALYTDDYDLISRSLKDIIIEPNRSMLIPEYDALKSSALESGALGFGISGSGPSVFALSKGTKTAKKVVQSMSDILAPLDLAFDTYVSNINQKGIQII